MKKKNMKKRKKRKKEEEEEEEVDGREEETEEEIAVTLAFRTCVQMSRVDWRSLSVDFVFGRLSVIFEIYATILVVDCPPTHPVLLSL